MSARTIQAPFPVCRTVGDVRGTVDDIQRKERTNGTEYWIVSISGQRYSAWDKKIVEDVLAGDQVDFTFTTSGRYRNLKSVRRLPPGSFVTADNLLVAPEPLRIIRMNCLRTSAEMLRESTLLPEQKLSLVQTMAERLEQHVLRPPAAGTRQQAKRGPDTGADEHDREGNDE